MTKINYIDTSDMTCVNAKEKNATRHKEPVCAPSDNVVTTEYLALVGEGDRTYLGAKGRSDDSTEDDTVSVTDSVADSVATGSSVTDSSVTDSVCDSTGPNEPKFLRLL